MFGAVANPFTFYRLFALLLQRLKCEWFRIVVMLETDPRLLNGTMTTVEAFRRIYLSNFVLSKGE